MQLGDLLAQAGVRETSHPGPYGCLLRPRGYAVAMTREPGARLRLIAAGALLLAAAVAAASAGSSEAAFAPGANGLIALSSDRDGGDSDVFTMGADGSAPTNLTSESAAGDSQPAFSPDGTRIAFTRLDGGDLDVFTMGADGSAPTNLTSASATSDSQPAFSPDGTTIAFRRLDGGDLDVFVMGADGSAPTNLTSDSAAEDSQPVFSPDGTRIAFRSFRDGGDSDVFVMGADGSAPINLTSTSAAFDSEPDWQRLEPPDTDPPETTITKGPKKKTEKRKAKFEFSSDEPGSTFECKLDKGGFEPCDASEKFKLKRKRHTLEVRAVDPAGNVDPTPAERKWRIKKKH